MIRIVITVLAFVLLGGQAPAQTCANPTGKLDLTNNGFFVGTVTITGSAAGGNYVVTDINDNVIAGGTWKNLGNGKMEWADGNGLNKGTGTWNDDLGIWIFDELTGSNIDGTTTGTLIGTPVV